MVTKLALIPERARQCWALIVGAIVRRQKNSRRKMGTYRKMWSMQGWELSWQPKVEIDECFWKWPDTDKSVNLGWEVSMGTRNWTYTHHHPISQPVGNHIWYIRNFINRNRKLFFLKGRYGLIISTQCLHGHIWVKKNLALREINDNRWS